MRRRRRGPGWRPCERAPSCGSRRGAAPGPGHSRADAPSERAPPRAAWRRRLGRWHRRGRERPEHSGHACDRCESGYAGRRSNGLGGQGACRGDGGRTPHPGRRRGHPPTSAPPTATGGWSVAPARPQAQFRARGVCPRAQPALSVFFYARPIEFVRAFLALRGIARIAQAGLGQLL